jgi:hypothetical protein
LIKASLDSRTGSIIHLSMGGTSNPLAKAVETGRLLKVVINVSSQEQ